MVRPRCWLDVATLDFFGQALRDDALSTLRRLGKLLHEETEIHVLSFSAECLQLCRFSDAGMPRPSPRSDSRRPKSAKARNRGVWGTDSAAGAMGIWRRRECWGS